MTFDEMLEHEATWTMGMPCTFYDGKVISYVDHHGHQQELRIMIYEHDSPQSGRTVKRWVVHDSGGGQHNWTGGICA